MYSQAVGIFLKITLHFITQRIYSSPGDMQGHLQWCLDSVNPCVGLGRGHRPQHWIDMNMNSTTWWQGTHNSPSTSVEMGIMMPHHSVVMRIK